jgi:hypothetical protein
MGVPNFGATECTGLIPNPSLVVHKAGEILSASDFYIGYMK